MSSTDTTTSDPYEYMNGFGNEFETESLKGALPKGQNTPQKCPYGLYAEQLSGSAFTVPRAQQQRTWLYRIYPTVKMTDDYTEISKGSIRTPNCAPSDSQEDGEVDGVVTPEQFRWSPPEFPENGDVTFVQGIITMCGSGHPSTKTGLAIHLYAANADMKNTAFYNADGDFLIVPQQGTLDITTEMGKLQVAPSEICVIQRGIKFSVNLPDGPSRGYILEVYNDHFRLPDLGPIGSNGLANPRDFQTPVAWYEDRECSNDDDEFTEFAVQCKYMGGMFEYKTDYSVFNVVAWHGNYAPYKYDLNKFCTHNTVSYDHTDPSIFTVLTCPSASPGTAVADFVIFPARWSVAENTFRPPYAHRNTMTEFMGLIHGEYDAKTDGGFLPGGSSLHSCMSGHGPDAKTIQDASNAELTPVKYDSTLAFMFETCYMVALTDYAVNGGTVQEDYWTCWKSIKKHFDPENIQGNWEEEE